MDWLAAIGTLVAVELVTRKKWQGFALHVLNGGLWLWIMWHSQLWGLVALEVVFVLQASTSLVRWRRANA